MSSRPPEPSRNPALAHGFIVTWAFAVGFYFLEYAVRSPPSVMIPELSAGFHTTALGVSSILGYYYTYSIISLVAGAARDRFGAKRTIPVGVVVLGIGCLLFAIPAALAGNAGRLLQGAGSAFAFTWAVYVAAYGFPLVHSPLPSVLPNVSACSAARPGSSRSAHHCAWRRVPVLWVGFGVLCLVNAVRLFIAAPREKLAARAKDGISSLIQPYKIVFSNPQSYLCEIVTGLLFAPTTIGDMI